MSHPSWWQRLDNTTLKYDWLLEKWQTKWTTCPQRLVHNKQKFVSNYIWHSNNPLRNRSTISDRWPTKARQRFVGPIECVDGNSHDHAQHSENHTGNLQWLVNQTFSHSSQYSMNPSFIYSGEWVSEERGVWEKLAHRGTEPQDQRAHQSEPEVRGLALHLASSLFVLYF